MTDEPDPAQPDAASDTDGPGGPGGLDDGRRRYPSTIGGAFYLAVLAVTAVGVVVAATGDWRPGVRWIAGGLVAAAVLRLVLPTKDAGMLRARSRLVDVVLLGGAGAAILFLSSSIPEQPPF